MSSVVMSGIKEKSDRSWIALDIGGANLKIADGRRFARVVPFELWHRSDELKKTLATILGACSSWNSVAVTMTGELADCYRTKEEGVRHIIGAVTAAAAGRMVKVYLTDGRLVDADTACEAPLLAAASNWHALATFCSQLAEGRSGLLLDMGSTTTDIIPFTSDRPAAEGHTDPERLVAGELVYTGVERGPVCSLVDALPWGKSICPVAQEVFATTVDAYLILGDISEDSTNCQTADGRPRTKESARDRLAHSICADRLMFSEHDAMRAAEAIRDRQLALLGKAVSCVVSRHQTPEVVVVGGSGEFLLRQLVEQLGLSGEELSGDTISLSERLGPNVSECAPAHALAVIARQGNVA